MSCFQTKTEVINNRIVVSRYLLGVKEEDILVGVFFLIYSRTLTLQETFGDRVS